MEALATRHEKIKYAFEIWTVRPFEMMAMSPEAKELVECSFDFAQAALKQGYQQFEATIAPVLAPVSGQGMLEGRSSAGERRARLQADGDHAR